MERQAQAQAGIGAALRADYQLARPRTDLPFQLRAGGSTVFPSRPMDRAPGVFLSQAGAASRARKSGRSACRARDAPGRTTEPCARVRSAGVRARAEVSMGRLVARPAAAEGVERVLAGN